MRRIKLITSLALLFVVLSCSVFDEFENSGMQLSHERANSLYTEYNENLKPMVQSNRATELKTRTKTTSKDDFLGTEYVWISKERLKMYLLFLESLEEKNNLQPDISGVSIYFGRNGYTDEFIKSKDDERNILKPNTVVDYKTPVKSGDYRGRLTVFFAPTIRVDCIDGDEMLKHKAFYIQPKDDSPKNKYVGQYKLLDFLFDVPFKSNQERCDQYSIAKEVGPENINGDDDTEGEGGGTSVLGNDVNNMPPKTIGNN